MVKKKIDKKIVSKKIDKKTNNKAKDKASEKETASEGISFNFSMKIDNEGLNGNLSFSPANELSEEQKEIFEDLIKNSIQNIQGAQIIRVPQRKFHNIFNFPESRPQALNRRDVRDFPRFW